MENEVNNRKLQINRQKINKCKTLHDNKGDKLNFRKVNLNWRK